MTVVPCMGHTGQHDLIAYICLADALDRNREAVIFRIQGQPVCVCQGVGGGRECAMCVSYITWHQANICQQYNTIIIKGLCRNRSYNSKQAALFSNFLEI